MTDRAPASAPVCSGRSRSGFRPFLLRRKKRDVAKICPKIEQVVLAA